MTLHTKIIILFWGLWLQFNQAIAQDRFHINIDMQSDLKTNTIYDILEDKKGYIWLSTELGLCKFNGSTFQYYLSNNLSSTAGSNLKQDKFNRIWYQNFDGYLYFIENDSLKTLPHQEPTVHYSNYAIINETLLTLARNGINIYNIKENKLIKNIPFNTQYANAAIQSGNYFYFLANKIIYKVDINGKFETIEYFSKKDIEVNHFTNNQNKGIFILDKQNKEKTVYYLNHNNQIVNAFQLDSKYFIQNSRVIDNNLYLLTAHGAIWYELKELSFAFNSILFPEDNLSSILKDYQGNFWMSTLKKGVKIIPDIYQNIYLPNAGIKTVDITNHNTIRAFKANGDITEYDSLFIPIRNIPNKTKATIIYKIFINNIGQPILLIADNGTYYKKKTHFQFHNAAFKDIVRLDHKYYAYASSGAIGLIKLDPLNDSSSIWDNLFIQNQESHFPLTAILVEKVRSNAVVYLQSQKAIICNSNIGLLRITPDSTQELLFQNQRLYGQKIIRIADDCFILGNNKNIYTLRDKEVNIFPEIKIIGQHNVQKMFASNETLIIITSNSIITYHVPTKLVNKTTLTLNASEINDVDIWNDQLLFTTPKGIIKYKTHQSTILNKIPKVYIASIKAKTLNLKSSKAFQLSYDHNNIQFNLEVLNYNTTVPYKLYAQLNQNDWKSCTNNAIDFFALSPGTYTLQFKINDTLLPDLTTSFTITPPFWKSSWFIVLLIGGSLIGIFTYYRWKNKKLLTQLIALRQQYHLEHSLQKSILKSIKAQMNPHFFYNALNTIQAYIFDNDKYNATNYLSKFSKLTRMILEMSDEEYIKLSKDIEAIQLYLILEKMRFQEHFNYEIKISEHLDSNLVKIPSMLIQPYIENAIKHGLMHIKGNKKLIITFSEKPNNILEVIIDDNGIGRIKSEQMNVARTEKPSSFSTQSNLQRLDILNAQNKNAISVQYIDKTDAQNNPLGTTVILNITKK